MLGHLGGVTAVATPFAYRYNRAAALAMWAVYTVICTVSLAYGPVAGFVGGLL